MHGAALKWFTWILTTLFAEFRKGPTANCIRVVRVVAYSRTHNNITELDETRFLQVPVDKLLVTTYSRCVLLLIYSNKISLDVFGSFLMRERKEGRSTCSGRC